jgi:hypothetical protein
MPVSAAIEVFAFTPTTNPAYVVAFGIIAIVLVLLMMYSKYRDMQSFREKKKKRPAKAESPDRTPELIQSMRVNLGPDKKELKQIGLFFNFSDAQNQYVKKLCAEKKIVHPGQIFSDYEKIGKLLGERIEELAALPAATKESEIEKTTIFLIREAIENRKKIGKRITSSRMIPERQELSLTLQSGEQHRVELLHNTSAGIVCSCALNEDGTKHPPVDSYFRVFHGKKRPVLSLPFPADKIRHGYQYASDGSRAYRLDRSLTDAVP